MTSPLEGAVRHPKIYAWTDPRHAAEPWNGNRDGVGLIKVGYTERDDVNQRIRESRGVASPIRDDHQVLLAEAAITDDGHAFTDNSVHKQLERLGARRLRDRDGALTEWFEATSDEVRDAIDAVRHGEQATRPRGRAQFEMRDEQRAAVEQTAAYFRASADEEVAPHFLWNAKMRFGKTFTTYQLAKEMGWARLLVLTYKPGVETSWRDDLEGHADFDGWRFKGKDDPAPDMDDPAPLVWFASFQDVLGTDDDGNPKAKNEDLYLVEWDAVVIDEYHFGAWREAARSLYVKDPDDPTLVGDTSERGELETPDVDEEFVVSELEEALALEARHYLYLSGTPFRAITQGEFLEDQVFNWTYADEQHAKDTWDEPRPNPYAALPRMQLLGYEMPEKLKQVALNNQAQFSLTEFFRTEKGDDSRPVFVDEQSVQKWLDLLRGQDITGLWANVASTSRPPLPYEDTNLLRALQHTIWYLPSVDACRAMRDLLEAGHNTFFHDYNVIVAAGREAKMGAKALPPVTDAIGRVGQDTKTITLTCGKLLTGVTVPEWAGILMLRELKSPESYFQAAFRVQSPWRSTIVDPVQGGQTEVIHKHECFVIDFSPNRALTLIVDYATRLRAEAASERDDEAAVEEFLEYLPVLSFDGYGMKKLAASDVLDHLTSGVSASMLARRWNSSELITLDVAAMTKLLANDELLASLESIEVFRNIRDDLTAMISSNKELRDKKLAKDKLNKDEKKRKKDAADRRDSLKKKLQRFITRIPAFMYLTDDRERKVKDIIEQVEPELFEKVTGLTLEHFRQLVDAAVFDSNKMNDAVWKFRQFERPSLRYTDGEAQEPGIEGGWDVVRDPRLAEIIDQGLLNPGDELVGQDGAVATVTEDYGLALGGIRYSSPDEAAAELGASEGWSYWIATTEYGHGTLDELATLVGASRS